MNRSTQIHSAKSALRSELCPPYVIKKVTILKPQ
jgi:hypothetical protein